MTVKVNHCSSRLNGASSDGNLVFGKEACWCLSGWNAHQEHQTTLRNTNMACSPLTGRDAQHVNCSYPWILKFPMVP